MGGPPRNTRSEMKAGNIGTGRAASLGSANPDVDPKSGSGNKKRIVIKLSGKVFSLDASIEELRRYSEVLVKISKLGNSSLQPIVVAGGGEVARHYIDLARDLGCDESTLDIMGIEVSRLNARLLVASLGNKAHPTIPRDLEEVALASEGGKIVVTGGLHPGQSTNATSALIAEKMAASLFLNATDVDGIYESDPVANKNARFFEKISVSKCLDLLAKANSAAGTYDLMDIVALKVIERSRIRTLVLKAKPQNLFDVVSNMNSSFQSVRCTEITF